MAEINTEIRMDSREKSGKLLKKLQDDTAAVAQKEPFDSIESVQEIESITDDGDDNEPEKVNYFVSGTVGVLIIFVFYFGLYLIIAYNSRNTKDTGKPL